MKHSLTAEKPGVLRSRWLPLFVGICAVTVTLWLWRALLAQEHAQLERTIQLEAAGVKNEVVARMQARILALVRMARRWEDWGQPTQEQWEFEAELYVSHFPGYQAIAWVNPQLTRWVTPPAANEAMQDLALAFEQQRQSVLEAVRDRREVAVTRSIDLMQGGKGFLVYIPIFQGENCGGIIVGVFRVQELLDTILHEQVAPRYSIALFDGEEKIYSRPDSNQQHLKKWGQETTIELYGVTWRMQVWPRPELLAGTRSALPQLTLGMGLLMAILLALEVNLAQTARLRARAVEAANQGLEREISGREQMEEALREAKEAAEAANRAKSEFLASMSHELRTPLGILLGYIDLLLEKTFGSLREEQVDTLRRIDRSARELFDLITAVLDLSRLEAGRLPVEVREVQVPELLEELKAETQEVRERASLEFVWQVEGELPPLQTDPGKVKVVVKNLIGNAVKFTKAGSITVAAHNHDGGVEISVTDTGVGISQEAIELIFEPFHQVDNSGQLGGTGLGLHIVKRLLELLGGTVTVESEVGRGSTFRVWVPRVLHTP